MRGFGVEKVAAALTRTFGLLSLILCTAAFVIAPSAAGAQQVIAPSRVTPESLRLPYRPHPKWPI